MSLLQTLNDEFANINDIAALIRQDPALTTELIRLCNSPMYYSTGQPICSVDEAVKRIGTEQVTALCLALCACSATSNLRNDVIDLHDYWRHCLLAACVSSVLAESIATISNSAAFTGGLLHDIGQLPLFYEFPNESMKVLNLSQLHPDKKIVEAERHIFGFTHEEIGRRLAEKWSFPTQLGRCLSRHHHCGEFNSDEDQLAKVVLVGNILSESLETQEDPVSNIDAINPAVLKHVLPDVAVLPEIFQKATTYYDDVQSSILV